MNTQNLNSWQVNNVALYTEDDIEFKKELLPLVIKNMHDLKTVILLKSDLTTLKEAAHKFKTTISMVNDVVLINCLAVLLSGNQDALVNEAAAREAVLHCDHAISALEDELSYINGKTAA